jgi:hypothetical protein
LRHANCSISGRESIMAAFKELATPAIRRIHNRSRSGYSDF